MIPAVTLDDVNKKEQKDFKHLLKERAVKAYEAKEAKFADASMSRSGACRTA